MKILIDSREQKNWHITSQLKKMGIPYEIVKLETGDYSFELEGISYVDRFSIERKANWNELKSNLMSKDHKRIKAEFQRANEIESFFLLIEDQDGLDGIENSKNYSYKITNTMFRRVYDSFISLRQFERKEAGLNEFPIIFCHKAYSAKFIINLILNYIEDNI